MSGSPFGHLTDSELPENFTPGEVFWMYFTVENSGNEWGTITCKVIDEDTGEFQVKWKDLGPGTNWRFAFDWAKNEKTDFLILVETGHWNAEIIVDEEHNFTIKLETPPNLCTWIADKGGPTALTTTHVVEIINSYIFETPPSDWMFVPTAMQATGIVDYYIGFDGDAKTGCDFMTRWR